jgi:RNA polymerase sigma factor (sigma-70 family)
LDGQTTSDEPAVTTTGLNADIGSLLRLLCAFEIQDKTDGQLLSEFLTCQDQAAFAALVRRHGRMVWGVCQRILRNVSDAEDAFQATFLILVRRAASLTNRSVLGDWLHGVARRTALNAHRAAARRRAREQSCLRSPIQTENDRRDWLPLLDEELSRLPQIYRQVIVLCDLESKTRKQAAQQLGIPQGTVAGRLVRARALLARRLSRRGVVSLALAAFAADLVPAGVPAAVVSATVRTAALTVAGKMAIPGLISAQVAALVKGALKAMWLTKVKVVMAAALVIGLLGASTSIYHQGISQAETPACGEQPKDLKAKIALAEKQLAVKQAALKVAEIQKTIAQAKLKALKVEVQATQAAQELAKAQLERLQKLANQGAVGVEELDAGKAKYLSATAHRQKAEANLVVGEVEVLLWSAQRELAQAELAEVELRLKQLRDQLPPGK